MTLEIFPAAIRALVYLMIGVTGEVLYAAIKALIQKHDLRLQGYTQIWVMPAYALGGIFIFEKVHGRIATWNIAARFGAYALLIYALEYPVGTVARWIAGKCPGNTRVNGKSRASSICPTSRSGAQPGWSSRGPTIA